MKKLLMFAIVPISFISMVHADEICTSKGCMSGSSGGNSATVTHTDSYGTITKTTDVSTSDGTNTLTSTTTVTGDDGTDIDVTHTRSANTSTQTYSNSTTGSTNGRGGVTYTRDVNVQGGSDPSYTATNQYTENANSSVYQINTEVTPDDLSRQRNITNPKQTSWGYFGTSDQPYNSTYNYEDPANFEPMNFECKDGIKC